MSKFLNAALALGLATPLLIAAAEAEPKLGLGRPATEAEIAAWDIDVRPDGLGLPPGSGTVADGEVIFTELCSACHGVFGEGAGRWPVLAGGFDTLKSERPVKTIGSYWPYLSTVFDYVRRAMPFGDAQSLSADETYALTAYLLYLNDVVTDEEFELSRDNFGEIAMPNEAGFAPDVRPDTPLISEAEPCMSDCKPEAKIISRARALDVTPDEEGASLEGGAAAPVQTAAVEETAAPAIDAALAEDGEKVFRKCRSCHQVGDGAKNRTGPHLNGVIGREAGSLDGFSKYSSAMEAAGADGLVWTPETLAEFLEKPREQMDGTRMAFAGLRKAEDRAALIEYLKQFSQ